MPEDFFFLQGIYFSLNHKWSIVENIEKFSFPKSILCFQRNQPENFKYVLLSAIYNV